MLDTRHHPFPSIIENMNFSLKRKNYICDHPFGTYANFPKKYFLLLRFLRFFTRVTWGLSSQHRYITIVQGTTMSSLVLYLLPFNLLLLWSRFLFFDSKKNLYLHIDIISFSFFLSFIFYFCVFFSVIIVSFRFPFVVLLLLLSLFFFHFLLIFLILFLFFFYFPCKF